MCYGNAGTPGTLDDSSSFRYDIEKGEMAMDDLYFMDRALELAREAAAAGVQVLAVDCAVTEDSMTIGQFVPVVL